MRIEQHLPALLLLTLLLGGCTTLHVQVDRWGGAALTVPTMADVYVGSHIGWGLGLQTLPHRAAFLAYAPETPYGLGNIIRACLPRITALGVASSEEVEIETLQERLDQERSASAGIYIGDVMFGSWARKV